MITYFVVQSFSRSPKGAVVEDIPLQLQNAEQTIRKAKAIASAKVGVVAFSRTGDPTTGDWDEAVMLAVFGTLPSEEDEEVRLAS